MRIGSLFTGYGGLDIAALSVLDADLAWVCDTDPAAATLLDHHHPDVPNLGDVAAVDWTRAEPVEVLTAGFPCQDVSVAGKRIGLVPESRTGLWGEVVRAVAHLRPHYVLLENVIGLMHGVWDDEPNDRCVCGWTYRRGGMHRDSRTEGHLQHPDRRGDDGESSATAGDAGARVRRMCCFVPASDQQVGCSCVLGDRRGESCACSSTYRAVLAVEGGASTHRDQDGGDQTTTPCAEGSALPMDGRSSISMCCAEAQDARAEPERAVDPATGENITCCSACGRDLGDKSSRSVFRSGLGSVLWPLAALGFDAEWTCVPASAVGAPHRRDRWFLAAADTTHERHQRSRETRRRWDGPTDGGDPVADSSGVTIGQATVGVGRGGGTAVARPGGQATPNPDRDGRSELPKCDGEPLNDGAPFGSNADGRVRFGDYWAAVAHWQSILERPAPSPTQRGRRGGDVLSPKFVEWLMGLPEGWVTGVALSRNQQLKLLGNGVVPQQAAAAFDHLLPLLTEQDTAA